MKKHLVTGGTVAYITNDNECQIVEYLVVIILNSQVLNLFKTIILFSIIVVFVTQLMTLLY